MTYWFLSLSLCYISPFFLEMRWDGQESLKSPEEESINTGDKDTIQSRQDTRSVGVAMLNQGGAVASYSHAQPWPRSSGSRQMQPLPFPLPSASSAHASQERAAFCP